MPTQNSPDSAERFVPHRPPILMLSELMESDGKSAEGIASIPRMSPFLISGLLPRPFFVELLSQLIAAMQGHDEGRGSASAGGYLVGVQKFECCRDAFADDLLSLYVRKINQVEGLHIFEGKITRKNELVAAGEIRCFLAASSEPHQPEVAVAGNVEWNGQSSVHAIIDEVMEIISLDAHSGIAEACVRFMPDAPVFAGHFPGRPIVPGVVWVQAGLALAAKLLSRQMTLRKIVSARFKKPIGPEERVKVELDAKAEGSGFILNSQIKTGNATAASFELLVECT